MHTRTCLTMVKFCTKERRLCLVIQGLLTYGAEDEQSARLVLSQELLGRLLGGGKIQGGGVNAELGPL